MRNAIGIICLIAFMVVMLIIGLADNGIHGVLAFLGLMLGYAMVYLAERRLGDR